MINVKPIDFSVWEPTEDDPRYSRRVGQRSAKEVFKELEQRLDSMGMLPDEYLCLAPEWEDGRAVPEGADIFVTTDYGGNEGIYLDAYLKWYEDGKPVTQSFLTGKTLGESGADLDRMFLISSAITKAFHGYGRQPDNGIVLWLSAEEKKEIIDALVEKRERMLSQTDGIEKLLRHATGSITAYMDTVGERPLRISDLDKAILAVQDGELQMFRELVPKLTDHTAELLVAAAGRTGEVGRKMVACLLAETKQFSESEYLAASRCAVDTGDTERVKFLMDQHQNYVKEPDTRYYGEVIDRACDKNKAMAHALIAYAPDDWIAAADSSLHIRMSCGGELRMTELLLKKGLQPGDDAPTVLQNYTCTPDRFWMAEGLLKHGMAVRNNDYYAFDVCVRNKAVECAKLLIEKGFDLDGYIEWSNLQRNSHAYEETISTLKEYRQSILPQEESIAAETSPIQGLTLGGLAQ